MQVYVHRVHYYETDKMGCVHHSNHIRWMEEARVAFLEELGIGPYGAPNPDCWYYIKIQERKQARYELSHTNIG